MSLTRLASLTDAARSAVTDAIGQAAERTGVDFSYLLAQARSESGLNPTAKAASSSATGLYQFLDQSWLAVVKRHGAEQGMAWAANAIQARPGGGFTVDPNLRDAVMGLREQAGPAALMAASYAADNAAGLAQALGRPANATDLYFAHFLGLGGATRFLRAASDDPDTSAAALFPREAGANRAIFYQADGSPRSLAQIYQLMGRKLANAGAGDASTPAVPGSLSPTPPGAASLHYASLDPDAAAGEAAPTHDVADALAALQQTHVDLLRPTPAQARLAYLMLSTPMA